MTSHLATARTKPGVHFRLTPPGTQCSQIAVFLRHRLAGAKVLQAWSELARRKWEVIETRRWPLHNDNFGRS